MTFKTQQDAYKYVTTDAELMNEEFCGSHNFIAHKEDGNYFLITVTINPEAVGITHYMRCDVGCSTTNKWSLVSNQI